MALPIALFALIAGFGARQRRGRSPRSTSSRARTATTTPRTRSPPPTPARTSPCCGSTASRPASPPRTRASGPAGEHQTATGGLVPGDDAETVGGADLHLPGQRLQAPAAELNVVATGSSGTVSRRVNVGLKSVERSKNVFADEKLIGRTAIDDRTATSTSKPASGTNGRRHREAATAERSAATSATAIGKEAAGHPIVRRQNHRRRTRTFRRSSLPPTTSPPTTPTAGSSADTAPTPNRTVDT